MKYISIFLIALLFSCSSKEKKSDEILFEVSKAVHVKMTFERLSEFENNKEKKKELNAFFKTLNIDSNPGFIGWQISKSKEQTLNDFIEKNKNKLLIDKHHSFLWKKQKDKVVLFQKNNKETLNLTRAIKEYEIKGNSLEISLIPEGSKALRLYTLASINKTLLLQINHQLISAAISLGDFKDGTLTIENINLDILTGI